MTTCRQVRAMPKRRREACGLVVHFGLHVGERAGYLVGLRANTGKCGIKLLADRIV